MALTLNLSNERVRKDFLAGLLFIMPNFLGFLIFVAMPVFFSLAMAFTNWDLTHREPFAFIGLENFKNLLWGEDSQKFWKYFLNTIYFMMGIPVSVAGSLILALMLSQPIKVGRKPWQQRGVAIGALVLGLLGTFALAAAGKPDAAFAVALIFGVTALGTLLGVVFFRTLFYLPFFTSGVALFILWKNLYNPEFGLITTVLRSLFRHSQAVAASVPGLIWQIGAILIGLIFLVLIVKQARHYAFQSQYEGVFYLIKRVIFLAVMITVSGGVVWLVWRLPVFAVNGLEPPRWLLSVGNLWGMNPEGITPSGKFFGLGARDAIIIMGVWCGMGGNNMLLYLAGLSNVPQDLYEAAEIDGANQWAKFWNVTWPQLAPTTFFIVIMSCIGGLQGGFEQARVMTQGGPAGSTITLGYYIYQVGFEEFRLGLASAISWVMFVLIFGITLFNWRFGNRYV